MIVEYRVLGPLEVLLDGEPVPVPAGHGRVLLATLLLRPNEFVSVDELVERLWEGEPPAPDRAHKTLQMVVARLRQALGAANCVRTVTGGYTAVVEPQQLDLTRFRRLAEAGEHRAALDLWRGHVLVDVASESLHRDDVPLLVEEQIVVLEHRIDDDLNQDTDVLVAELRGLVSKHPLRETFWAQLMLALHRSNRQAEALAAYEEVREHLANELGVDPGARLKEAHRQVLAGEVLAKVPRQLPAPIPHFVGRQQELARLTELLDARPGEPVLISAINGVGGVGKTALALQWAHQVADRFPDGQLYVNLRGFDTRAEPLDPFGVARDFLLALGVKPAEIPASEDALVAHYRSVLAQRRVLLLLDNARDVDQVRPLLPGGSANLVLITSRNQLRGLVAREGARPVALDVLDEQGATDLLTERVGSTRVQAEPDAAARLVAQCAGLPLALGVAAARVAFEDSLDALADELENERLDALDVDDTTGVRAVFSWSMRALSDDAGRLFVLLGLHAGPDFAVGAAASLAGLPVVRARRALDELVASSLAARSSSGRFVLHDLLREYAEELAAESPERHLARQRMFDHYLHTTWVACTRLEVGVRWPELPPPAEFAVVEGPADLDAAIAWFEAEHSVLLGVFSQMEAAGADDLLWTFAYSMHIYSMRRGLLKDAADVETRGLAAAQRQGSLFGESRLNRSLAGVYLTTRDFAKAEFHMREGLRCDEELGDEIGQSNVSRGLAFLYEQLGRPEDALEALRRVHPLMSRLRGKPEGARFLGAFGRAHHLVGESERGLELCLEAEALFDEIGRRGMEVAAESMNRETMGDIYRALGRHTDAVAKYEHAVALLREARARLLLADALVVLAKTHIGADEHAPARAHLKEALALYEEMGNDSAAGVRDLLGSLS